MKYTSGISLLLIVLCITPVLAQPATRLQQPPVVKPLAPPLTSAEHLSNPEGNGLSLPLADTPFIEHVRGKVGETEAAGIAAPVPAVSLSGIEIAITTPLVEHDGVFWVGTAAGLYSAETPRLAFQRYPSYGIDGPVSSVIAGLAVDSKDTLWVATPAGLSSRSAKGAWTLFRGTEGLPWEELTCIAIDAQDRIWLGSTRGLIQYRPYAEGRQWFYRFSERYLPQDAVSAVAVNEDGSVVYAQTEAGWSKISEVERTLYSKAEYFEKRLNERHRRLGLNAPALYDDAYARKNWTLGPQPSDGLWAAYHITAMGMAYTLTGEDRYKESAQQGMEGLYLLQNVTGVKGLVARTVVAADDPYVPRAKEQDNWHETADGKYFWRDDVSSDQYDGHFFAFYTYYEHIAKHDPVEKERIQKQVRQVMDYMLDNNYQIIDWDGERTRWGWFNPEVINIEPVQHLEAGIYSLMMLSFLKTTHHITGDQKYEDHYVKLIEEHDYLTNLILQKKTFPDELNHSDDQLSAIAFYPILQIEQDPLIRDALMRALRRHARIERDERNSLFALVYASVAPEDADIDGALRTLREMPQDRRNWGMDNTPRKDVVVMHNASMGGHTVLRDVLPADERDWERWNMDPFRAKTGGDGRMEGTGVHYMLPYWIARYHGVLTAPEE